MKGYRMKALNIPSTWGTLFGLGLLGVAGACSAPIDDTTDQQTPEIQAADTGSAVGCGDSVLAEGELCDDGNTAPNDGCSELCTVDPGFECSTPGELCVVAG
jgi:cysteine-rich repeat protein